MRDIQKRQKGFTLVELMIVVTVVAILAAIAVPVYQNYAVRAKISEALSVAGACKTAVSDYMSTNNTPPLDLSTSGCSPTAPTQYVGSIDVVSGVITVTLASASSLGLGSAAGGTISLTPSVTAGNFVTGWTCSAGATNPVPANLLPGPCRSS